MSKNKVFYYFASYSCSSGFGRAFIRLANDLSLREIEEVIMDHDTSDVLDRILGYITSSKNNLTNNDMEYFKKHLIEEEKELAIKVDKLTKFIGSERFNILSETEGALLKRRLVCMNGYLDTLRFENEIMKYKL